MASPRIRGNHLKLSFGTPAVDVWADHTKVELDNEEASSDVTTFEDASKEGGARQYFFSLAAVQSTDKSSFWRYAWDNAGKVVPFVYAPHGNAVASEAQPHFTGMVKVGARPKIGGEAGSTPYTFETRWNVEGEPALDIGSGS